MKTQQARPVRSRKNVSATTLFILALVLTVAVSVLASVTVTRMIMTEVNEHVTAMYKAGIQAEHAARIAYRLANALSDTLGTK